MWKDAGNPIGNAIGNVPRNSLGNSKGTENGNKTNNAFATLQGTTECIRNAYGSAQEKAKEM